MHCYHRCDGFQANIAELIVKLGENYVLSVKQNQRSTFDELENCFIQAQAVKFEGVINREDLQLEKDYGRIEKRLTHTLPASYCKDLATK